MDRKTQNSLQNLKKNASVLTLLNMRKNWLLPVLTLIWIGFLQNQSRQNIRRQTLTEILKKK